MPIAIELIQTTINFRIPVLLFVILCSGSLWFVIYKTHQHVVPRAKHSGAIGLLALVAMSIISAIAVAVIFVNRQETTGETRSMAALNQTCFDQCRKTKGSKTCTAQCGGATTTSSSAKRSTKPTPVLDSCYTACRKDKGKKVCDEKCGTTNGQQQTGQGGATTKGSCAFYDCTRKLVYDNERGNGHLEPGCCGPTCVSRCGVTPAPTQATAPTAAPAKTIAATGKTPSGSCPTSGNYFPCSCGCFTDAQFLAAGTDSCAVICSRAIAPTTAPKKVTTTVVPTPKSQSGSCPVNSFSCSCGCFSDKQFVDAGTSSCAEMCSRTAPTSAPAPAPASKTSIPSQTTTQPITTTTGPVVICQGANITDKKTGQYRPIQTGDLVIGNYNRVFQCDSTGNYVDVTDKGYTFDDITNAPASITRNSATAKASFAAALSNPNAGTLSPEEKKRLENKYFEALDAYKGCLSTQRSTNACAELNRKANLAYKEAGLPPDIDTKETEIDTVEYNKYLAEKKTTPASQAPLAGPAAKTPEQKLYDQIVGILRSGDAKTITDNCAAFLGEDATEADVKARCGSYASAVSTLESALPPDVLSDVMFVKQDGRTSAKVYPGQAACNAEGKCVVNTGGQLASVSTITDTYALACPSSCGIIGASSNIVMSGQKGTRCSSDNTVETILRGHSTFTQCASGICSAGKCVDGTVIYNPTTGVPRIAEAGKTYTQVDPVTGLTLTYVTENKGTEKDPLYVVTQTFRTKEQEAYYLAQYEKNIETYAKENLSEESAENYLDYRKTHKDATIEDYQAYQATEARELTEQLTPVGFFEDPLLWLKQKNLIVLSRTLTLARLATLTTAKRP